MGEEDLAQRLVDAVIADFPDHKPGTRPVHTIGIGLKGHFRASDAARHWCIAAHFQGEPVPVNTRFSNGSGSPVQRDGWPDVRGMATRFHLPDGSATDLVAMTLREFFSRTVDDFLAFSEASRMTPFVREGAWNKFRDMLRLVQPLPNPLPGQTMTGAAGALAYANHHLPDQLAVFDVGGIGAPVSYARAMFHAVHSFILTGPDGLRHAVRFDWRPTAGVKVTNPAEPPRDDYLQPEIRARVMRWPVEFLLVATVAEAWDAIDDPTRPLPTHRKRVVMGTLTLTEVAADQETECEKLGFNPCRLVEGIELSGDPILAARRDAYQRSQAMRGATPCPFGKG
ncbi:MAG: catalase [Sphingomonadaceae bacterium]